MVLVWSESIVSMTLLKINNLASGPDASLHSHDLVVSVMLTRFLGWLEEDLLVSQLFPCFIILSSVVTETCHLNTTNIYVLTAKDWP